MGRMRTMRAKKWIVVTSDPVNRPMVFHCVSRVVDRWFVFGDEEREAFRMFVRMTGSHILRDVESFPHFA